MGAAGGLHCVGMCGPLALMVPGTRASQPKAAVSAAAYHLGRLATYSFLGLFFGQLGQVFTLAGWQRWLSLSAGLAVLGFLAAGRFLPVAGWLTRLVVALRSVLGDLLRGSGWAAPLGFGLANALLPCGLVYVACAGAAATGEGWRGAIYMAAFGLGTVPWLAFAVWGGSRWKLPFRSQSLIPACAAFVGVLLVIRGLGLGIPLLSPKLDPSAPAAACCH